MRSTIAIALLLGASVQAVLLEKKQPHKDSAEIALKKKELAILEKDVAMLRQDYQTLHEEELAVSALARPFAEGMGDGEKVGETIHMNDQDVITIPPNGEAGAERFTVHVPQKHSTPALARPFADGMTDGEKVDETLRIKDGEVINVITDGNGYEPHVVNVAQRKDKKSTKPFADGVEDGTKVGETLHIKDGEVINVITDGNGYEPFVVNVAQKKHQRKFAEGMTDGEKVGETLKIKDDNVITIPPAGENGAVPLTVNVAQKKPANQRKFAEGMGTGEKVGETLNIRDNDVITVPPNGEHGAEDLVVNVAQQKALANKGFHNQRKFAEGMGSGEKVGETLTIKDNNVITIPPNGENGAVPLTVNVAQKHHSQAQRSYSRPIGLMMNEMVAGMHPHHITDALLMTDDEYTLLQADPGAGFPNDLAVEPSGTVTGKPGLPSQSTITAAPEKEWQQWAQDFVDWEDGQTDAANARLPYASTFAQLSAPDDNPGNLEDFIMEDSGIPLNMRL